MAKVILRPCTLRYQLLGNTEEIQHRRSRRYSAVAACKDLSRLMHAPVNSLYPQREWRSTLTM